MALSYDDWKNQWEWMTDVQRARVSQSMKDNATFQDYGKRYVQEQKGVNINPTWYQNNTQNTGSTVSNNQNWGTNNTEWTNTQPTVETPQNETNNTEPTQWTEGNGKTYWKTTFDPEETLQEDKFWTDPWKITIYEWTGKDTGRPDYEIETQERLDEMTGNLDHYYATQPKLFSDRKTFNEFFQYNDRPSDQQRALLDSYWQKKQDENKAKSYTSWDALAADLNSWNMTQDVWNQVMEWNQKAYQEWEKRMKDEKNLAIANFTIPFNLDTLADTLQSLVNKLWIQAGDPYDIIWGWENKMQELWAYQSLHELDSTVNQLKSVASQRQNIINRYASSAGGTQSDALVAARLNKALAPYDQQFSDLYTLYQTQHTTYQTKLGTANQYAQVMYQQAQEDQRIFNNKIKSLGFAMEVNSYRTPEQQAQLWLQVQSIQNDMNLLNQAKQNDLALYNKRQQNQLELQHMYDTAEMQNAINLDMTDLTVENEWQLRANLNNVLSQYYAKFWDIIKRPQSWVVEDVLRYAKEHWVSVAEALQKEFIEKLMEKEEYQNYLSKTYPAKEINDKYNYTIDENWNIKISVSWDWKLDLTDIQKQQLLANKKSFEGSWMKWAWLRNNNPWNIKDSWFWNVLWHDDRGFAIFSCPEDWFDALVEKIQNIQRWWSKTYSKDMTLYQFFAKYAPSSDNNNPKAYAESVARQLWTNANATVWSVDATKFAAAIAKHDSWYDYSTYWQFRSSNTTTSWTSDWDTLTWKGNEYDLTKYPWWNELTDDEKITVQNLLTYQTDPATLPKTWNNWESNKKIRAAAGIIGRDFWYDEKKFKQVDAVQKQWDKSNWPWGNSSANSTAASILKSVSDSFSDFNKYDINAVNWWINYFRKETGDPDVNAMYTDLRVAAWEIAKALKGNASATEKEIDEIHDLLSWKMSTSQAQEVFKHFASNLLEKNASEAKNYARVVWYKPESIYLDDVNDWFIDSLWINVSQYYDYNRESKITQEDIISKYWWDTVTPKFDIKYHWDTWDVFDFTGTALAIFNS